MPTNNTPDGRTLGVRVQQYLRWKISASFIPDHRSDKIHISINHGALGKDCYVIDPIIRANCIGDPDKILCDHIDDSHALVKDLHARVGELEAANEELAESYLNRLTFCAHDQLCPTQRLLAKQRGPCNCFQAHEHELIERLTI